MSAAQETICRPTLAKFAATCITRTHPEPLTVANSVQALRSIQVFPKLATSTCSGLLWVPIHWPVFS